MSPSDVLRTLAQLAGRTKDVRTDVVGDSKLLVQQRYDAMGVLTEGSGPVAPVGDDDKTELRLLSAASLHKSEQLLRVRWIWIAGTVDRDGERVTYCVPDCSTSGNSAAVHSLTMWPLPCATTELIHG